MNVSVVIATYNAEKYITEQLDSIYRQVRKPEEVLIYDDGSSDGTIGIILDFINTHNLKSSESSWCLFRNEQKKGCVRNFIESACSANGDIIFYSDQDDIWDKRKISIMAGGFEKYPDMRACCCQHESIDEVGNPLKYKHRFMTDFKSHSKEFQKISFAETIKYNVSPGLCLAFKRELIHEIKNMILDNGLTHDLPIGVVASIYNGYYFYNRTLVYHRLHTSNISKPADTFRKRKNNLEFQVSGRISRIRQMKVVYSYYGHILSYVDRKNLCETIKSTEKSVNYLKNKNLIALFLSIFNANPMMNNWIAVTNFLVCLFY